MSTIDVQYLKIKALGDKENEGILSSGDFIVITEKIDGGNFRFQIKDGKLLFGSHKTDIEDTNASKNKMFKRCIQYVQERIDQFFEMQVIDHAYEDIERYVFFGENCVKHTINYDWTKIPPFLGFDIYDTKTGRYLNWDQVQKIYSDLGFETVPEIRSGNWGDELTEVDLGVDVEDEKVYDIDSVYYTGKAEGIVIKNYGKQLFAKIVSEKFKEVNKENFGGHKHLIKNDNDKVLFAYCTNARIVKIIFKLRDLGMDIDRKMMTKLPTAVWNDICDEHCKDILQSDYSLTIKDLRRDIAKRCLAVLDSHMINESLNKN
jgi:hypothetical protein